MNVIDSSGWLEYLSDGPQAASYRSVIKDVDHLLVPVVCLFEVFKITLARAGEDQALYVAGLMSLGTIVELDREIALEAAKLSVEHKLPMADSFIYATAQAHEATLWTQDQHFAGLPGVKLVNKN
jgi:predicted nucleic acid-binding protein